MKSVFQFALFLSFFLSASAQTLSETNTWRYTLVDGAAIMDDCPVCDRLSFWEGVRGTFDLKGTATPQHYIVTNIHFVSDLTADPKYQISGSGILDYQTGAPELTLTLSIARAGATETVALTNAVPENSRIFPMIGAQANENPGSMTRVYRLRLQAAPFRELWFSTEASFTMAKGASVSDGDILANTGRVVRTNGALTDRLALEEGEIGLDALDIGPRGEVFFSPTRTVESIVNGTINHGDVVTSEGRVYLQNRQLLAGFDVDDPEAGLDAFQIVSDEEVYFSVSREVTRSNGAKLKPGDILSSQGRIVRSEANLLIRFMNPLVGSVGVDALYVWPNGEIWFSPQTGFTGTGGVIVEAGDILSDQGYIVYRNFDLLAPFAAVEPISDFGLDAMTIVSDAAASGAPIQITDVSAGPGGVDLRWEGLARIFQLERATSVEGPYSPMGGLMLEREAHDDFTAGNAFYRVRQW